MEVSTGTLQDAIRNLEGCESSFGASVPVKKTFSGETIWEDDVRLFELIGHPEADCAYVWSYEVIETGRRRFAVVLHKPPVDSPQKAVQASITAEYGGEAR